MSRDCGDPVGQGVDGQDASAPVRALHEESLRRGQLAVADDGADLGIEAAQVPVCGVCLDGEGSARGLDPGHELVGR
jgi:hypothetical protein